MFPAAAFSYLWCRNDTFTGRKGPLNRMQSGFAAIPLFITFVNHDSIHQENTAERPHRRRQPRPGFEARRREHPLQGRRAQ